MSKPRCWSFHPVSGEPVSAQGCRYGRHCSFVHPDSPRWKDAPLSRLPPPLRERSPGRDIPMKSVHKDDRSRWADTSTRGGGYASSSEQRGGRESPSRVPHNSYWGDSEGLGAWGEPAAPTSSWGTPSPQASGRVDGSPATATATLGQDLKPLTKVGGPSPTKESYHRPNPPPPPSLPPPQPPPPPQPSSAPKPSLHVSTESAGPSTTLHTLGKVKTHSATTAKSGDMRKVYLHRVTQFLDAVLLNFEYDQVLRTLDARRKMLNSQKYSHVSETSQLKLDGYAHEYEEKARELKSRLNDTLSKLADAETWPDGLMANDPPANHEAILIQFQDIQGRLESLEMMVKDLKSEKDLPPKEDLPSAGTKRRPESPLERRVDVDVLNRLEQLETRFDDASNEAMQQTDNLLQKVETRIEEKLEALRVSSAANEDVEMRDDESTARTAVPVNIQEQIIKLSRDFDGFVDEMVDLVEKHRDLVLEMKSLLRDNQALRLKNIELESTQEELKRDMVRMDSEVQVLLSAVRIIKTAPPAFPSPSFLEQMREQIRAEILHDLSPILLELRQQCESAVTSGWEETLKHIRAELGHPVRMVNKTGA